MANSNYRLLLDAQINPQSLDAQIKAISTKSSLLLNVKFNQGDLDSLNNKLEAIKATGAQLSKITIFSDDKNAIGKAAVEYLDTNKNIVKTTLQINEGLVTTKTTIQNLSKYANEFSTALKNADIFIEKAKSMPQTPKLDAAVATAQGIKVAVEQGDIDKVRQLNDQLAIQKASLGSLSGAITNWTNGLSNAVIQAGKLALTTGLVYGAMNQLKEGVQYLKDLNKELTNTQLVTGGTDEEVAKLAKGYNDLAKEMGSTTVEIAKGSLEYIRQGKNQEETAVLIQDTMMLAKLGNMEAADATERLTAVMNGFKLEAKDVESVVDKLVQLDNNYATSVDEISTAMRYSANSAQQAGVDFDHLAAYITVISSTTRMSAETIGQSLKTMFARLQDIKAGKIDEDGLGINNVESALARVNIHLRDSRNNFRDMQDVIQELGQKWETLDEIEQANVAKAIAGVRQKEQFLVLMGHQAEIQRAINKEEEANGLARQRYDIYLKSIEASQNRLTASWEEMVSGAATKEFITNFYDGATAVLKFVNSLGGIPTILKIAIPLLIAFNLEWLNTQRIAAMTSLNSIVGVFRSLISVLGVATPALTATATAEGAVAAGATAMTAASAAATLGLTLLVTGVVLLIEKTRQLKQAQEELRLENEKNDAQMFNSAKSYEEYAESFKKTAEANNYLIDENGKTFKRTERGVRDYSSSITMMSQAMWNAKNSVDAGDRKVEEFNRTIEEGIGYAGEASDVYTDLASTMKNLVDSSSGINDLISKSMEGNLDFSDISSIPAEYMDALSVENGQLTLNIDLIKQKQIADAEMSLEAIKQAEARGEATFKEVSVVQAYYDQLIASSQETFGAFNQTAYDYDALLWKIANDAVAAGYTFKDMEGNALNSAQSIHDYMAQGSTAFNSFVSQAAQATGRTTAEVMNVIKGMVAQSYNETVAMIQALRGYAGYGAGLSYATNDLKYQQQSNKPKSGTSSLFPTPAPVSYGGGSGGGGSSGETAAEKKKREKAEARAKAEQELQKKIDDAQKKAVDGLKDQLNTYKDILDARKKLLDSLVSERKYQQDIEDKNKNILDLQNRLAVLQLDNSAEAAAERLALQDELAKAQRELENTQYEHSIDAQKDALDADYAAFESRINSAIEKIEAISADSMESFASQLSDILGKMSTKKAVPKFHDGVNSGVVGGNSASGKSNEVFAKLIKGEVVVNEPQADNFIKNILPQMVQGSSSVQNGNVNIEMPINIQGNVDKAVMGDLKKIVEAAVKQINDNLQNRGYTRRADAYSI